MYTTDGVDIIEREDGENASEAIRITSETALLYVCGSRRARKWVSTPSGSVERDEWQVTEDDWQRADAIVRLLNEGKL